MRSLVLTGFLALAIATAARAQEPDTAAAELRGVVRNGDSQQPVDHASVVLPGLDRAAVTGADGEFRIAGVPAGKWRVEVAAKGFGPVTLTVEISARATRRLEVVLPQLPAIYEEVVVTANGRPESTDDLSQSTAEIATYDLRQARGVGLDETMNLIPGVRAESQAQTQEVRISIRGRGERTSFGVSGIRLMLDGFPETDPTGETTDLTGIDPAALDRVEVVKGPMAGQYGASSSGVVNVITPAGTDTPWADVRGTFGSFGLNTAQGSLAGTLRPLRYFVSFSDTGQDGYRQYSRMDATHLSSRFDLRFAPDLGLSTFVRQTTSRTELPGNLSQSQVAADPLQANSLFLQYKARSDIDRFQFGSRVDKRWGARAELTASGWAGNSDFTVPVPFVILQGHRINDGGNGRYFVHHEVGRLQASLNAGVDYQRTNEDRTDPVNLRGEPGPASRNEQRTLDNIGAFATESLTITPSFGLRFGINRSNVGVEIQDFLAGNSGVNHFTQTSYFAGARQRIGSVAMWYANVATGFDPPTISAIGRRADGAPGINMDLKPERSMNYEAGGSLALSTRAMVHAAVYHLRVEDEIVPTGTGVPQQTFMNAALTSHNSLELSGNVAIVPQLSVSATYTLSSFIYDRFVNLVSDVSGNRLPGVPRHRATASIRYRHPIGITAGADWIGNGQMYVNDANTAVNQAYKVTAAHLAYDRTIRRLRVGASGRVDNLFNERYSAYTVINDRFGQYYYPSSTRYETVRLTAGWCF
jgi:iron complex outermembrane receptor protein